MDKRYQVFISSTFADLKDERSKVIQTVMEMDCIPAGMEIFPAIDEDQFNFIKRVIDDCDYYIVIIGGRYGSLSDDGISYTEKEYDYALEKGLKVIGFLHKDLDQIPVGKSEKNPELKQKLLDFRKKVSTQRLVKFWEKAEELPGFVALSLSKTIKTYPAIGWVRSNSIGNSTLLVEINELRKENQQLKEEVNLATRTTDNAELTNNEDLAGLDDNYKFKGSGSEGKWEGELSWGDIFYLISPFLMQSPTDNAVIKYLGQAVAEKINKPKTGFGNTLDNEIYQTIKVHLSSLNLVDVKLQKSTQGGMALFWSLTEFGKKEMMKIRSVKKK